ncbi:esterase E4-like [Bicyclus anynana]|uniref:Esterase E4-like n=1 Tax=Bicyclus anynana TaxID=110368 RepID=A0ABM3LXX6_BICAN|nr:esterase E4-like [Bicyclus anynana]
MPLRLKFQLDPSIDTQHENTSVINTYVIRTANKCYKVNKYIAMAIRRISLMILFVFCLNEATGNLIVETKSGKISGKEVKSIFPGEKYYSFLSIPYALPPIGDLRFKAPVPHPGWEDVLEAKNARKTCAQFNLPQRSVPSYGFTGDEDCLHLSIHTPKPPSSENALPVIVFLYNEHFKVSYNATKEYGNDFFMREEVIIVTLNHRLGSLGFVSFEDEILPGNNGIRDVILALKWVKDNINNFGGDPSKITLMGNYGGGVIVDILLHSPKAKGLFSAAVMQSQTSFHPLYIPKNPKKRAIALADQLNKTVTTSELFLQRMSDISAFEITKADILSQDGDEGRLFQRGTVQFGPVLEIEHDDAILTKYPEISTVPVSVPVMIGFNSREAIELSEGFLTIPAHLSRIVKDIHFSFPRRVNYHLKVDDNIYLKANKYIRKFYFEKGSGKGNEQGELMNLIEDMLVFYPIDFTVHKYTNNTDIPVYYYMFDYSGELNFRKKKILERVRSLDGTWGASIGDELCYLFVCQKHRKVYRKLLESEDSEEIKVLRTMVKLFTDFAKTGNPTPPGSDFTWIPATKDDRECLIISDTLKIQPNLYRDKVKFWDDFIEKYEKLAVDGVVKDIKDEL